MVINNLKIKTKLFLLFLIPAIMITYLSFDIIFNKYILIKNAKDIKITTKLSVKISDLVHELQKERGMSSAFITSKGTKFIDNLKNQKKLTDLKYLQLREYYNISGDSIANKVIISNLNNLLDNRSELLGIRERVLSLTISKDKMIRYFSAINEILLDSIYESFKYSEKTVDVRDMLAYRSFLYAKEKTGIERAEITSIFIKDFITEQERLKISNLRQTQKIYLKNYFKLVPLKLEYIYNKTIDFKLEQEISKMESIILDSSQKKDFHIDGYYWFAKITQKIENLKTIEDYFANFMIDKTVQKEIELTKEVFNFIVVGLFILFMTSIFMVFLVTRINKSLEEIRKGILLISDGKLNDFRPITLIGKNELTIVAETLNSMVNSLNKKDKRNREQNEKLLIANEKATHSVKAKSEFLANMSHEIRTPLNAILGFIDLLKEENIGKKSITYINIIDNSSKGLLKIIEDILDFSKIESGKLEIDKIDFNTKEEFEIITHLFLAKCSENNITLTLNLDENLPKSINTDPLRIKQVISNLLSNAIKFTSEHKKIVVTINYTNSYLNVSVKDEGKGIAKDKLLHIFESFSQEDSSTTREYGGTGLGLTISSELVKLLGGELKVKSELDVGSEFYFSIPVTIAKDVESTKEFNEDITFKGEKILLVEDNKANQMFMGIILNELELEVEIANDGVESVEMFKQNSYDLILMDENMPNMDGIEATQQILNIESQNKLSHTPIIALTANALKGDREKFLNAGMDEYLTKPIDKRQIAKALREFL